jgi:presenilin-like A22 family membrane protease
MVIGEMSVPPEGRMQPGVVITHPNRDKPVVQATRATVVLLLLASAALVLIVTVGGWKVLESAKPVDIGYIVVYVVLAFFAARWNRGVLPVAAVLAVLLLIFSLVAGPSWFSRDKSGFEQPDLSAGLLGLLTLLLVPLQILLIAFAMRGFGQGWNVEVERPAAGAGPYGSVTPPPGPERYGEAPPQPA